MNKKMLPKYVAIDKIDDLILYSCSECNTKYIGKGIINIECKQCNENSRNKIDDKDEYTRQYKTYMEKGYKSNYKFIPHNGESTNNWIMLAEAGEVEENIYHNMQYTRSRLYLQCKYCGSINLITKVTLIGEMSIADGLGDMSYLPAIMIDKINCKICNHEKIEINNNVIDEKWKKHKEAYEKHLAFQEKEKKRLEEYKKATSDIESKERAQASNETRIKDVIHKVNDKLEFISAYTMGGRKFVKVYCKVCGTPKEIEYNKTKDLKDYKCVGCEIRENKDPNYVGLYSTERNIEGITINYITCIEDNKEILRTKCNACGNIRKDINREKFLSGKYTCGCEKSTLEELCPNCGNFNEISIREFIKAKHGADDDIVCKKCGFKMKAATFMDNLESMNVGVETRYNLKDIRTKIRNFDMSEDKTLAVAKEIAYYGHRSGKAYKNCRCIKHHQSLVLSEDEIINYDHSLCNSINNIYIKGNLHNLTLNINGTDELNTAAIDKLKELK